MQSIEEVIDFAGEMEAKRDDLDYEIDGLVVKVNSTAMQDEFGTTNKAPRWAIAFKYAARQATTKVLAIGVQVGRTGALTPVAFWNQSALPARLSRAPPYITLTKLSVWEFASAIGC